jgi:hypothetical protein
MSAFVLCLLKKKISTYNIFYIVDVGNLLSLNRSSPLHDFPVLSCSHVIFFVLPHYARDPVASSYSVTKWPSISLPFRACCFLRAKITALQMQAITHGW